MMTTNPILQEIYDVARREEAARRLAEMEPELFSIAVHETAHGLVAAHFGLEPEEMVLATNGVCVHRSGTRLANAAVSIAGVMGESLMNAPMRGRPLPKTKLTALTLQKWLDEVRLHTLSNTDRSGIEGYPSRWEAARVAFEVLSDRLDALEYLARRLLDRSLEKCALTSCLPAIDELEIQRFIREQGDAFTTRAAEKNLRLASARASQILESLPPVKKIPSQFTFATFLEATGASETDVREFCAFKILRERNQIGLGGAPPAACEVALTFFREHGAENRDRWINAAREFCAWREQRKSKA
jgi:hypothetical protein